MARQLEHVVGVARFRADAAVHGVLEFVGREKVLRHAVAADGKRALTRHEIPKVARRCFPVVFARQFIQSFVADEFGNLRVGVASAQRVAVFQHRNEELVVSKMAREPKVTLVARQRVNLGERLRHAAVFNEQNLLHLLGR